MYQQLDIYWVDLEPAKGAETKKKRPCIILQSNLINKGTQTIIVSPHINITLFATHTHTHAQAKESNIYSTQPCHPLTL